MRIPLFAALTLLLGSLGLLFQGLLAAPLASLPAPRGGGAGAPPPASPRSPGRLELPRDPLWAAPPALAAGGEEGEEEASAPPAETRRGLRVRVFGVDNAVVRGAHLVWVEAARLDDPGFLPPEDPQASTDAGGWAELEDLPEGPVYLFATSPEPDPEGEAHFAWREHRVLPRPVDEAPEELELCLEAWPVGKLEGRVITGSGEPADGVELSLRPAVAGDELHRFLRPFLAEDLHQWGDGSFAIPMIGGTSWIVEVRGQLGPESAPPLASRRIGLADVGARLELVIPDEALVRCRLWSAEGRPAAISGHSLSWHRTSPSGGAGGGMGMAGSHGRHPEVRFVWPEQADEVRVELTGAWPERGSATVLLTAPTQACEAYLSSTSSGPGR
ncbi:MAG: hypothetical protein P1V51_17390 [Deltaproteobacteria bacterium]|nr:hypothetical protein [Deltaproteobacteria bacterium]